VIRGGGDDDDDDDNLQHLQLRAVTSYDSATIRPYDPLFTRTTLWPMSYVAFYCWTINLHYLNKTLHHRVKGTLKSVQ
jgi:hypothetical protein